MVMPVWAAWEKRHLWPNIDPPGYVFLGRAFERLAGELIEGWVGNEIAEAERAAPPHIPSAEQAYRDGKPHFGFHQEYAEKVADLCPGVSKDDIPETLWRAVADDTQSLICKIGIATDRRDYVVDVCSALARAGELQFGWRRKGGAGTPTPIPPESWHIDYPFVPFATLGYSEEQGLCSAYPTAWLFVTAQSLDYVMGTGAAPQQSPEPETRADPSYRAAVEALASSLDTAGIPIRAVTTTTVEQRWNAAIGRAPLVKVVTGLMKGAGRGGRPANKP